MCRNTNISTFIRREQLLHSRYRSLINRIIRLPERGIPKWIFLSEALFERPVGVMAVNNRLATSPITGMCADDFSEVFFDGWNKWVFFREVEPGERDACCC